MGNVLFVAPTTGQVPTAALSMLPAGPGSFDMYVIAKTNPAVLKIEFQPVARPQAE